MSFKRPPTIQTQTPVRSSDRRKLIASLSSTYPHLSVDEAKALVPEGILISKFMTHTDTIGVEFPLTHLHFDAAGLAEGLTSRADPSS